MGQRVTRILVRLILAVPAMAEAGVSDFVLGALLGDDVGRVIRAEAARWRELATKAGVTE